MRRPDIVNQISQAIQRVAPTATAILYGSEARGDARDDSDIDVLASSLYSLSRLNTGLIILLLGANIQKRFQYQAGSGKKDTNICRMKACEGVLSRNESRNIVGGEP